MALTSKEINDWLQKVSKDASKNAAEIKAYTDAKAKHDTTIKAAWGVINTAYNELNGLAGGDKVATDAKPVTNVVVGNQTVVTLNTYGVKTATGSKAAVNGTKIEIPGIFHILNSFPAWWVSITPSFGELDWFWWNRFKGYKTNNQWDDSYQSNVYNRIKVTHTIYLSWAHQFLTSKDTWNWLDKNLKNVTAAGASADLTAAVNGYANLKAQKDAVIKKYNTFLSNITVSKKAIDTAETEYQNALNKIIRKGSGGSSSTSGTGGASQKDVVVTTVGNAFIPPMYTLPNDVEWNLPPHKSSLPIAMDLVMGRPGTRADDSLRRGRFWFYADSQATFTQSGTKKDDKGRTASGGGSKKKYGFQFLWNPQTFSTSVQLNDGMTPSSTQYWQTSLPVFPSGQNLDVQVVISRINDFASFGSLASSPNQAAMDYTFQQFANVRTDSQHDYAQSEFDKAKQNMSSLLTSVSQDESIRANYTYRGDRWAEKIKDLYERGTLADIEYIYRTVNGDGWQRLGQITSDIGFLMMNLVEIEIGPNRYLGYLNSLSINHEQFTQYMVPIHSVVNLSFVLMSSAKVAQTIKTK